MSRHTDATDGERLLHEVLVAEFERLLVRLPRHSKRFANLRGDLHARLPQTANAIEGAIAKPGADLRNCRNGIGEQIRHLQIAAQIASRVLGQLIHRSTGHAEHRGALLRQTAREQWHLARISGSQHQNGLRHGHRW